MKTPIKKCSKILLLATLAVGFFTTGCGKESSIPSTQATPQAAPQSVQKVIAAIGTWGADVASSSEFNLKIELKIDANKLTVTSICTFKKTGKVLTVDVESVASVTESSINPLSSAKDQVVDGDLKCNAEIDAQKKMNYSVSGNVISFTDPNNSDLPPLKMTRQ